MSLYIRLVLFIVADDKVLNVVFIPMELQVPSYGEVEFQVSVTFTTLF